MNEYSFEISMEGVCLVATFQGEISTSHYSDFRNDYNEIFRRLNELENKLFVMDLTKAEYFGSLFIGMVVKLSVAVRNQNGHMVLCGLSDQLQDLMKKLLLLERESDPVSRLKHVATREEALAELNAIKP